MLKFLHPCYIIGIKSCIDKPFSYFYKDVWSEWSLKESRKFLLFENGPNFLLVSLAIFIVFQKLILPLLMKLKSKPFNLRPLLLLFNSFQFCINLIGFIVISCYITDFGFNLWTCKFKIENEFHKELTLHMGYIYFLSKILELLKPTLYVIRGKKINNIDFFNQIYYIMLIYQGFLFYPLGIFCWLPFVDTLYHTFVYAYLIFACTGTESMKKYLGWKLWIPFLNMFKFASIFGHSVVTFTQDCPGYYYLKVLAVSYGLFGFILSSIYMLDMVDSNHAKKKTN